MGRFFKSRDYLKKCLGVVLLLGFISIGAIGGCNNNGGDQDGRQTLSEHDFGQDEGLRADPEKHLIVKFLEHPDHDAHENDTGGIGKDVIPHTYTRALNHTFCWEDEDDSADHFMLIIDEEGNEIVRLHVGDCVTETILEGHYDMELHHDGKIDRNYPIFISHGYDVDLSAGIKKKPATILEITLGFFYRILDRLDVDVIKTTYAQTVENNKNTLITTNVCVGCNLSGANLSGADLSSAILERANLSSANLANAILTNANLSRALFTSANLSDAFLSSAILSFADLRSANLIGADLFEANLIGADLTSAFLIGAVLNFADLSSANLSSANLRSAFLASADLSSANLIGANLFEANFTNANLSNADLFEARMSFAELVNTVLSSARWCDGCICAEGSIGTCNGCAPLNTCPL